jgi:hypothetical protein
MMREYTEDEVEAAMDKPHHPLVIRPWKTQQIKQKKWNTPKLARPRGLKPSSKGTFRGG